MHEHKTITVLAAHEIRGQTSWKNFTLVTDHKGLEYFKTQPILSHQQMRWWEYLPHFNYDTIHIDGERNSVDALSDYFTYDTIEDKHPDKYFIKADEILDPDGDLIFIKRFIEIWNNIIRKSHCLQDHVEHAVAKSNMLNQAHIDTPTMVSDDDDIIAINSGNNKVLLSINV